MSSRGRSAALPPEGSHRRPATSDGLIVTHTNEKGDGWAQYDFAKLPISPVMQLELAVVFARRVRPTGRWRNLPSSDEGFRGLQYFAAWLSQRDVIPTSLKGLTRASWLELRVAASNGSGASLRALKTIRKLLLETDVLPAETRAEVLRRLPAEVRHETAYDDDELRERKIAAQGLFRRAHRRIRTNVAHLAKHRAGAFATGTTDYVLGEALEIIATTGDVPRLWQHRDELVHPEFKEALGGGGRETGWKRLYLDPAEVAAAAILIGCKEGWNATSIIELNVPTRIDGTALGNDDLKYKVRLEKRRRDSDHRFEYPTLEDTGPDSSARLMKHIIEATQPARELLDARGAPTTRLLVGRLTRVDPEPRSVFRVGVSDNCRTLFKVRTGLNVNLRRVRKAVNTRFKREPNQNTQETHDSDYVLNDPHVFELSEAHIARGLESALSHAVEFVPEVLEDDKEVGEDTATASCINDKESPFSPWGVPCVASFLLCLACHNAVVMPRHLGRLAYLYECLNNLRHSVSPATWAQEWDAHYERLHSLRTEHYSASQWQYALDSVTRTDTSIVDWLLKGALDG